MEKEVLLKKFNSNMLAEAAQQLLKSHGLASVIKVRGAVAFRGFLGDNYGADLWVLERDFEKAKKIINNE